MQRPQGVTIPEGQLSVGRGEPSTVYNVSPMKMFAIEYTDEHGKKIMNVAYRMGDTVYIDPNGIRWAADLREAAGYIKDAINKAAVSEAAPIPKDDAVDVMDQVPEANDTSPEVTQ